MISKIDSWRAANLLIRQQGADAELEAARLQDLMLDRGDDGKRGRRGTPSAVDSGLSL